MFDTFAIAIYAKNFYLAVFKKTLLTATTSTLDKFIAIFAVLGNTTLKRKLKLYKSNSFFFAAIMSWPRDLDLILR